MATPSNYLTVAEARTDLRLDGDDFDDATITRYIAEGVAMVSGITGRDLLDIEVADIDPGLQMLVSHATWLRYEGVTGVTPSLYALAAPYRVLVDPIVIAFLVAIAGLLQRVVTRVPAVGDTRARHRIETDSGLDHRPLTALDDELAAGSDDPAAQALWTAHRRRMAERAEELRLKLPRAGLTRRDPWAVRAGLVLIVLIGFVAAGNQSVERISRALVPPLDSGAFQQRVAYDVWITPPAYTQVAPIYFGTGERTERPAAAAAARTIRVPAGSTVLVQVSGGGQIPSLLIDETATELNRVEADGYHLETEITEGSRLSLEQKGRELAAWDIEVIADKAPVVTFTAAPETNNDLKLRLPFEATDDYGLKNVTASVRRLDGEPIPDGEREITLRLPFPGEGSTSAKGKSSHDLTSHVWAGLPVLVHLIATDERGQTGVSAVEPVVLPERHFTHVVARELVEVRKRLKATKQGRLLGALKLDNISDEPHRFQDNTSAYLAIRVARERLARDKSTGTVSGVQRMLWDIALQLEEGLSALASRDLRAAQEALRRSAREQRQPGGTGAFDGRGPAGPGTVPLGADAAARAKRRTAAAGSQHADHDQRGISADAGPGAGTDAPGEPGCGRGK